MILRTVHDGEALAAPAVVDAKTETETWWQAAFPATASVTRYRWLLSGGEVGYSWVNGLGRVASDVPDADDFVHAPWPGGPEWHLGSVVYQIFPDRFASSGLRIDPPDWAVPRDWDALPQGRSPETPREWFGGDLRGIEQHLDHVERLGANVLYLTPFFPARSTHRYDATTFARVDPLLGGDDALASLTAAAHARGMRVIGDLTLNHTGNHHEWFRAAEASPDAPERDFYYFDDALPHGYAAWWGIKILPKLNHGSPELAERLADVTARWLRPPYALDGWRIDVANMAGRYHGIDHNHELARCHAPRPASRSPGRAARGGARARLPRRSARRRLARDDELRGLPAAGVGVAARGSAGGAAEELLGISGRPAEHRRRAGGGDHARLSAPASPGPRRCTPGRSSTATTPRASPPSQARATCSSSGSASR